jgi:hypothetical protein
MSPDESAEPAPAAPLVILATEDDSVCVDELCVPADVRLDLGPSAPEGDA